MLQERRKETGQFRESAAGCVRMVVREPARWVQRYNVVRQERRGLSLNKDAERTYGTQDGKRTQRRR